MQQEIKYNGFTATPDDYISPDGDIAAMTGLIHEHGAMRPLLPPAFKFNLNGSTLLAIHDTSAFTHYITINALGSMRWLEQTDQGMTDAGLVHDFPGVEIRKVEPVGNTLIVLASDGVHYILWKNGAYTYLGTHLPELDLSFSLIIYDIMASDQHEVDLDGKTTPTEITTDKDLRAKLCQAVLASANQVTAQAQSKHCFTYPFFVRYAFRLYDGSLTMHSAPALMVPTMEAPEILMGWTVTGGGHPHVDGPAKVSAKLNAFNLFHHAIDGDQVDEVARWSDIISSVDVYVSPQFYTYDQAAKDDDIRLFSNKVLPDKDITQGVRDNGTFYLIKSIKINDIFFGGGDLHNETYWTNRPSEARPRANVNASGLVIPDFEPNNDNIVAREVMTDDYGTHDELVAATSFAYNGRINMAGVSKRLFNGFNPACMWAILEEGQTAKQTAATVVVEEDGREIVVRRENMNVYWNSNNTIAWFFYPHSGAKTAYLDIQGSMVMIDLAVHPTLNGAYYYGLASDATQPMTVQSIPAPSSDEDRMVDAPNKVYTSEVNNPFYFPVTGINTVGTGQIIGICSAVKALSQGQFGQFPLYAFTTEGVWALQTTPEGGYSAVQPVTRDVCIDADSITQLDDAVLFVTDRGIMLISGSTTQCISEVIDARDAFDLDTLQGVREIVSANMTADTLDLDIFRSFMTGARMLYDYTHQRIVVYNPGKPYAYVYSLESNLWGIMACNFDYGVNAYPEALVVDHDGRVLNLCEEGVDEHPAQVLITRPLKLGSGDVLKTVSTIIQRGAFGKTDGNDHVKQALYASRDLFNWHLVFSSKNRFLRGFSGTGFKYFRIVLFCNLAENETITGATIQFEPKYTNRLR